MYGAIAGVVGSVAGNLIGARSTRRANAATAAMAREQMQFQERMRDTAYQAAVKDLEKAGLNPMLAYSQGGAATPQGATSTFQPEFSSDSGNQLVSSAMNALRTREEVKQIRAATDDLEAAAAVKRAQRFQVEADTALKLAQEVTERHRPQSEEAKQRELWTRALLNETQTNQINSMLAASIEKIKADVAKTNAAAQDIRAQRIFRKFLQDNKYTSKYGVPELYDFLREVLPW